MSQNARRDFFGKLGALGASAVVGTQGEAPRTPGRDLERLRLCSDFVSGSAWSYEIEYKAEEVYGWRRAHWHVEQRRLNG